MLQNISQPQDIFSYLKKFLKYDFQANKSDQDHPAKIV